MMIIVYIVYEISEFRRAWEILIKIYLFFILLVGNCHSFNGFADSQGGKRERVCLILREMVRPLNKWSSWSVKEKSGHWISNSSIQQAVEWDLFCYRKKVEVLRNHQVGGGIWWVSSSKFEVRNGSILLIKSFPSPTTIFCSPNGWAVNIYWQMAPIYNFEWLSKYAYAFWCVGMLLCVYYCMSARPFGWKCLFFFNGLEPLWPWWVVILICDFFIFHSLS